MRNKKRMDVVATTGSLFALTLLVRPTDGSVGDKHHIFLECVEWCIVRYGCPQRYDESGWIFGECFRCRYSCIWKTVKYFDDVLRLSVPQFYGKWPFLAVWLPLIVPVPVQELASVIFSVLNLLTTLSMYRTVKNLRNSNRLKIVWTTYSVIGIVMWTCSVVFHWADFWLTEYLDYFAACAFIVFALFANILRLRLQHENMHCVLVPYSYHLLYMAGTAVEVKRSFESTIVDIFSCSGHVGPIINSILDFVPLYWIIDSHALFHLATVPLPLLMTRFIQLENAYEMQKQMENIKET
ncbi:unnamed protein product [Acanthocheilonema viteae]|uniref:Post-GPI attachment to proteins factor 3 n=1 Tax=Acanthocheilonema viteae TaxID=6277 RepID=A0A498S767_ACAVI|nr:unnamed protein product [Acanthocheilonema viteae]